MKRKSLVLFGRKLTQLADFQKTAELSEQVGSLLAQCEASEAASALIPWFCDVLASPKSRLDYFGDLARFFTAMKQQGIHPFDINGDHVRLYKEVLLERGFKPTSVSRALSVIRGAYEQFGKKGFVSWQTIGDIQSVKSPSVNKNTTPNLSEAEAIKLLHSPDKESVLGIRDHAILFVYFKTACRCSAITQAKVGDLERTDTDWYLVVNEKGDKQRRLALLESAAAILSWLDVSGIGFVDPSHPLFAPLENDRETPRRKSLRQ